MIEVKISRDLVSRAVDMVKQLPLLNNSHRKEQANLVGLLGELVTEAWLDKHGVNFIPEKNTRFDYRISHDNRTIDVKTKERTVKPLPKYDCSTPLYNKSHQIPDYFLYLSLLADRSMRKDDPFRFKSAFILGSANQYLLHKSGTIWRKDQVDPSNGTKFWTDCLNLHIEDLYTPDFTIRSWQESKPEVKISTAQILHRIRTSGQEAICSVGIPKPFTNCNSSKN